MEEILVEFACDNKGNFKAPITKCLESRKKKFFSIEKAISFIENCTYVYNLDDIFQNRSKEEIPPSLKDQIFTLTLLN